MLVSAAAYLRYSQELAYARAHLDYQRTLLAQFAHDRGLHGVQLLHAVSTSGAGTLALLAAACTAAGVAIRRALGARRGGSEALAFAVAAVVVPPVVMATVIWPDGGGRLTSPALIGGSFVILVLALVVTAWRQRRAIARGDAAGSELRDGGKLPTRDPAKWWAIALLAAMVPLLLATWWNGVDAIRGFDSLSDHLPRAARWLRLARLSEESGSLLTPYYPGNFQLLVRWFLVLGTDAYAFVPSLLASLACLYALFGICRELGQSRWTALVSTTAAASCSLLVFLSTTVEADTFTTAFLLLAVHLLLRWRRMEGGPAGRASLAAMGACVGLAIGSKYSALPPALALAAVAGWYALSRSLVQRADFQSVLNARTFASLAATFVVPMALTCGYWFARNLVTHGNPFYPVAVAGLPGVAMRYIIPVKPSLASSGWARLTYPWVQPDFVSPYDDGLGAAFAGVALVAFLVTLPGDRRAGNPRPLVRWITVAAYALWIGTGSITARFGLFPLLLTFAFVGEAWRDYGGWLVRGATVAIVLFTVGVEVWMLALGAVYTSAAPPARRGVPAVIDSLPPTRIFNATSAANRYPLLGHDYRHEVITMFDAARPQDAASSGATYMLLSASQVAAFAQGSTLVGRGDPLPSGDTLSLWRRGVPGHR